MPAGIIEINHKVEALAFHTFGGLPIEYKLFCFKIIAQTRSSGGFGFTQFLDEQSSVTILILYTVNHANDFRFKPSDPMSLEKAKGFR